MDQPGDSVAYMRIRVITQGHVPSCPLEISADASRLSDPVKQGHISAEHRHLTIPTGAVSTVPKVFPRLSEAELLHQNFMAFSTLQLWQLGLQLLTENLDMLN